MPGAADGVQKDSVGPHLIKELYICGADRNWKKRRNLRGDTEALGDIDDLLDAKLVRQPQSQNITALDEGLQHGH